MTNNQTQLTEYGAELDDCCIHITDLGVQAALKILYRDKCLGPHQTTTFEEALDACEKWMREIQPTLPRTDDARGDAACRDVIIVATLLLTNRPEEGVEEHARLGEPRDEAHQ